MTARRDQRRPVQHITGRAGFRTLELAVGPGVFVPRPETELTAQLADRRRRRGCRGRADRGRPRHGQRRHRPVDRRRGAARAGDRRGTASCGLRRRRAQSRRSRTRCRPARRGRPGRRSRTPARHRRPRRGRGVEPALRARRRDAADPAVRLFDAATALYGGADGSMSFAPCRAARMRSRGRAASS